MSDVDDDISGLRKSLKENDLGSAEAYLDEIASGIESMKEERRSTHLQIEIIHSDATDEDHTDRDQFVARIDAPSGEKTSLGDDVQGAVIRFAEDHLGGVRD